MRSESHSPTEADRLEGDGRGDLGGSGLSAPAWKIVRAGEKNSLMNDFVAPVMKKIPKLLDAEIAEIKKELKHGNTRKVRH